MDITTKIIIGIVILALLFFVFTIISGNSEVARNVPSYSGQFIGGGCGR